MRHPTPPSPILTADGSLLASTCERIIDLVVTETGAARSVQLTQRATLVALAADGALLAVADRQTLSLYDTERGEQVWRRALPAAPYRLALNDATVVAALRPEATTTRLYTWDVAGKNAPQVFQSGQYAAVQLTLAASDHLLVSGLVGPRAFDGHGAPLHRLLSVPDEQPLWEHSALPFHPDRVLLAAGGAMVAHTRRQLVIVDGAHARPALSHTDLETVAVSPSGRYAAWFWGRGPTAVAEMRVARLTDGVIVGAGSYFDLGHFPTLAVGDDGDATLAAGRRPNGITLLRLSAGGALSATHHLVHPA